MLLAEAGGTGGVGGSSEKSTYPEAGSSEGITSSKAMTEAEELVYRMKNQNLLDSMNSESVMRSPRSMMKATTSFQGRNYDSDLLQNVDSEFLEESDEVRALMVQARERAMLDKKYSEFDRKKKSRQ